MNNQPYWWYAKQIAESNRYPLSLGQIRHLLLHRHTNGLEQATRRVGKRLLIRMDLFDAWLENHAKRGS